MALRATLIETGELLHLDEEDQATLTLLEQLRGNCPKGVLECREHDSEPKLQYRRDANGQVHGAWLYVQRRRFSDGGGSYLLLAHNGDNEDELKSTGCQLRVGMSDEHRFEQDYLCRTGDRVGFTMSTEHRIPGARLDVYGQRGDIEFGFEVQLSALSAGVATRRDSAALKAGIPLTWTAHRPDVPWNANNGFALVATSNMPRRSGELGTWRVASGLRTFTMRPCHPKWFQRCPKTRGKHCRDGWHPMWEPLVGHGDAEFVDGVLEGIGEGRYARLDTRSKQGVVLLPRDKHDEWVEVFGTPGVPVPPQRGPDQARGGECRYSRLEDRLPGSRAGAAAAQSEPRPEPERIVVHRRDMRARCQRCNRQTGLAEGLCLGCRLSSPEGQARAAEARLNHWIAELSGRTDEASRQALQHLIDLRSKEK